jgi:hypothetical protein
LADNKFTEKAFEKFYQMFNSSEIIELSLILSDNSINKTVLELIGGSFKHLAQLQKLFLELSNLYFESKSFFNILNNVSQFCTQLICLNFVAKNNEVCCFQNQRNNMISCLQSY